MNRPKCYITIGIPCSGKSTYAEKQGLPILSCDQLRLEFSSNKKYKFNHEIEKDVWDSFYHRLGLFREDFIVDNTNLKITYIKQIIRYVHPSFDFEYVVFDVPLWKAKIRNIWRWVKTGKWIPISVMNTMQKNFESIKHLYK